MSNLSEWTVKNPKALNGQFVTVCLALGTFGAAKYPAAPDLLSLPKDRLVGRGGLEPPTSRLSGVRSNHLSYRPGAFATQMRSPTGDIAEGKICREGLPYVVDRTLSLVEPRRIELLTS